MAGRQPVRPPKATNKGGVLDNAKSVETRTPKRKDISNMRSQDNNGKHSTPKDISGLDDPAMEET